MQYGAEELRGFLRRDEQVCWQGETGRFRLLTRDARGLTLGKWGGTVAAFTAVILLYTENVPSWSPLAVALVLAVEGALLLAPVLEWQSLLGQRYWLTDQRAVMMTADRVLWTMELGEVDVFQIVRGADGQDCLLLGSSMVEETPGQLRWYAGHPKTERLPDGEDGQAVGMAFYGLRNAESGAACLRVLLKM